MTGSVIFSYLYLWLPLLVALLLNIASFFIHKKWAIALQGGSLAIVLYGIIFAFFLGAELIEIIILLLVFLILNSFAFLNGRKEGK